MIGESGVKKRIFNIVALLLLLTSLSTFSGASLGLAKSDEVEHKSVYRWRLGYYLEGEAEARNFIYQGVSKKSLKLELDGKWEAYRDQIISVDYIVNNGLPWILQENPRFYVGNYGREITIDFTEEAIQKISALGAEDELVFLITSRRGEFTKIEIPPEVLEEWLTVFQQNSN